MPQRATGRLTFAKCGAVVDIAKSAGIPRMHRIVITAGLECTSVVGDTYHVGKAPLISRLEAAMHTGRRNRSTGP